MIFFGSGLILIRVILISEGLAKIKSSREKRLKAPILVLKNRPRNQKMSSRSIFIKVYRHTQKAHLNLKKVDRSSKSHHENKKCSRPKVTLIF